MNVTNMSVTNVLVNAAAINKPKADSIRGVNVTTMLSPFDVPQSVLCEFDKESCVLIFKFQYLSRDKKQYIVNSDDGLVKLTLGKASNRVYEIELNHVYMRKSQPRINVLERTLNGLKKYLTLHPDNKSGSFDAVESVLEKYENKLITHALAC